MYAITSIRGPKCQSSLLDSLETTSRATQLGPNVFQVRTDAPPTKDILLQQKHEDLIVRKDDCWRHYPRLVVFDMDSTLINEECIDLLAEYAGVGDKVANITRRAMNGELDFAASLAARVALLKGLEAEKTFEAIRQRLTFAKGARALLRALKRMGCKTAVCSGGFVPLAAFVQRELGIDFMFANHLAVDAEGKLTGETKGDIVHGERKRELLLQLQQELGCRIEQTVAVGDGANDLPMLRTAGLGVAIHAKELVQRESPARIRFGELDAILYLFGLSSGKVDELCRE